MRDSVEDRVYALLRKHRGEEKTLAPTTTLSHDLGMDGDDAGEFFEEFAKEFGGDRRGLDDHWRRYFAPESAGLRSISFFVAPAVVLAVGFELIVSRLSVWLYPIVGMIAWLAIVYYWQKANPDNWGPQITVQDLIDYAKAGQWTMEFPVDARSTVMKWLMR